MILKGSQRAGGIALANHLLNSRDNDQVTLHSLRGFISDDLHGAMKEAHAVSRGTKCKQFLFSLSLNPPEQERVNVDQFESALSKIEAKLGLADYPRAVVFHEKEARRHAHAVWSRVDARVMRAINLSHFKLKLKDISRELYLENEWLMPRGLMNSQDRDPLNFTMVEWQQAKRQKRDPRDIKKTFQDCWAVSDTKTAFAQALAERGYYLAKGDRRGHVAVDWRGEIYAVSKWSGRKAKEVRAKLGDPASLSSVSDTQKRIADEMSARLKQFADKELARHSEEVRAFEQKRCQLVAMQRQARQSLEKVQVKRQIAETKERNARLPRGIQALWFRVTGKYAKIRQLNEQETDRCKKRDRAERQALIDRQLAERRMLQHEKGMMRHRHSVHIKQLDRDISHYRTLSPEKQEEVFRRKEQRKRQRKISRTRKFE